MAAKTQDERRERATEEQPHPTSENRVVWTVLAVLILVLAVAGLAGGGSSSKSSGSTVNQGTRAVLVPTDDVARTVIVPPCGTSATVKSADPAAVIGTTGAIRVELPQGQGMRIVLVPRCAAGKGASSGSSTLPSAAFVLNPGTPAPVNRGSSANASSSQVADPGSAAAQLSVPGGSNIRSIVVPPCEQTKPSGPYERVLSSEGNGSGTAVAPAC